MAELGIEPGHDAQWLEQAILEQSPDLEWIRPDSDESHRAAAAAARTPVPGQDAPSRDAFRPARGAPDRSGRGD